MNFVDTTTFQPSSADRHVESSVDRIYGMPLISELVTVNCDRNNGMTLVYELSSSHFYCRA